MNENKLPFMWFGYVITDNTDNGKGFWSPLPRFVTHFNRKWDYWSVRNEREFRYAQKQ